MKLVVLFLVFFGISCAHVENKNLSEIKLKQTTVENQNQAVTDRKPASKDEYLVLLKENLAQNNNRIVFDNYFEIYDVYGYSTSFYAISSKSKITAFFHCTNGRTIGNRFLITYINFDTTNTFSIKERVELSTKDFGPKDNQSCSETLNMIKNELYRKNVIEYDYMDSRIFLK